MEAVVDIPKRKIDLSNGEAEYQDDDGNENKLDMDLGIEPLHTKQLNNYPIEDEENEYYEDQEFNEYGGDD
jgi:hypothetical protein